MKGRRSPSFTIDRKDLVHGSLLVVVKQLIDKTRATVETKIMHSPTVVEQNLLSSGHLLRVKLQLLFSDWKGGLSSLDRSSD